MGPLRAEILCVGRALLRGDVGEQNARTIAQALFERGCSVDRVTVVDSAEMAVAAALAETLARNPNVIVTTGGLGPGPADQTLAAVSRVLRLPLTHHPLAQEQIERAYRRLHESGAVESGGLNRLREKLCHVPVGATLVPNALGIAPAVICRLTGGGAVICLPGAGKELRPMLAEALGVVAELGARVRFTLREVEASTADEAALAPLLERLVSEFPEVRVSTRPASSRGGKAIVTLETSAATEQHAESHIERAFKRLLALASGSH